MKKDLANKLMETIQERFESFENPLFQHMSWMDPKLWEEDRSYGNESLTYLATHFKVSLAKAGLDNEKLISEWKRFKLYIKTHFEAKLIKDETNGRKIWNHILLYCKKDFPNVCLLLQISFTIASSNAATERAFNISSLRLSDRRTKKMNHKTI